MYEFLVGVPPFEAPGQRDTCNRIKNVDLKFPDFISENAKDLILKFLQKDPSKRISLNNVKNHPFIIENLKD